MRKPLSIDKFASIRSAMRQEIETPATRFDEIDQAMADPIVDRVPQVRAKWKTRGVLNVLDQLDRNTNRRFTH